ncbi:hypothetical protein [Mammaliicoccus sp. E-M24]|uniref:hypothetical protein n=1 Tax=Mammaliicoccus sp. E-M24 TaxID=2898684 RepID=UPI001EFAEA43|nr:hypothetical protein [Mammaliicoccus sp. E-M24]
MNTEINYTNMDLKKITKNIKKITNKVSSARPVLQNMYFDNNKIVATDGHRLIRINYEHNKTNELFSPKNNEFVDCDYNYPSVERIIPLTENANSVINIKSDEIDIIISMLKAYKHLKCSLIKFSLNNDNTQYEMDMKKLELQKQYSTKNLTNLNINYQLENTKITDERINKFYLNVNYFMNIMEFIKDYNKTTLVKDYKIYIYHELKPIMVTTDKNDFQYVVCPVREY